MKMSIMVPVVQQVSKHMNRIVIWVIWNASEKLESKSLESWTATGRMDLPYGNLDPGEEKGPP